ncbi:MAG: deoxyguanosinetriphosphate triphosphohydrolase, partial [Methylocapsa sp.]|nr:deoxyguanosinetriphosphate triphosphohydrolase [Methylocapsa sp.]
SAQARPLIGFSRRAEAADNSIRNFLQKNVYRHPRLTRIRQDAGAIVRNLFARFLEAPGLMPPEWAEAAKKARAREAARARIVCDYIAGMTDRYACAEHRRLFGETQDLRLGAAAAGDAVR